MENDYTINGILLKQCYTTTLQTIRITKFQDNMIFRLTDIKITELIRNLRLCKPLAAFL